MTVTAEQIPKIFRFLLKPIAKIKLVAEFDNNLSCFFLLVATKRGWGGEQGADSFI